MEKSYNKYYNSKVNQKAVNKYVKKNYDDVKFRVFKGEKELLKKRAEEVGMSINSYIRFLLIEDGALPEVPKENKE